MTPATTEAKTVKGVALISRDHEGLRWLRTYGEGCDYPNKVRARNTLRGYQDDGEQIVDCTITFTPPKGRKKP